MSDYKLLKVLTAALALPLMLGVSAANAQNQDTTQVAPDAPAAVEQSQNQPVELAPAPRKDPTPAPREDVVAPAPETLAVEPAPVATAKARPATPSAKLGDLIGKPVFAADGKKIGMVTGMTQDSAGAITAVHVRTFGFFGFGAKTVAVPADSMKAAGKEVRLAMASVDFDKLPPAPKG